MKRTISLLLAFVMVLSMTACGQNSEPPAESTPIPLAHAEIAWDVSDIYHDQAAFEAELSQMQAQRNVLTALRGKLNTVDGVVSYYADRDELYRLKERLDVYTTLIVEKDQSDNTAKELAGKVSNLSFEIISDTAFALPEIFANADSFLDEVAKDERMKPYLALFSLERAQSAHTLSEAEEQLLLPINQLRDGAYYLYGSLANSDLTFPNVQFPDGTERLADENNYASIFNKTYSQEFRLTYYNALLQSYNQFRNTLAQNMQNYYSAVVKSAAYHKYDSALEAELAKGNTPVAVYDGVLLASDQAKPILSRYFALLKKNLNVSTLYSFDCNINIVDDLDTVYDYADAQKLIKEALQPLGADYVTKLDGMFSSDAIDVYPVENKTTGGFALSVPDVHPYILLNYTDDFESVSTLSHELGHAVHMLYSKSQESVYDQNVTAL
ncbi:MAG: M3 family metallopeptidase, partial [Oscillospiraceae bacterium]